MNYLIEEFKKTGYYDFYIGLVSTMNETYYLKDKNYGVNHTKRILYTSLINSYLNDVDIEIVSVLGNAIIYHDIGREKNEVDSNHGNLSLEKLIKLAEYEDLKNIFNEEELKTIEFLIKYHCVDYASVNNDINNYGFSNAVEVLKLLTILKDSVSLEFLRFGEKTFETDHIKLKTTLTLIETEKELLANKKLYDFNLRYELIKGNYDKNYSEEKFNKTIEKIIKAGKDLVASVLYPAMLLFNTFTTSKEIPAKNKAFIIASLGYLILPIDLIPDTIVAIGYTDDALVLIMAICDIARYISPEIRCNTKEWIRNKMSSVDDKNFEFIDNVIDKGMSFSRAIAEFIDFKKVFKLLGNK